MPTIIKTRSVRAYRCRVLRETDGAFHVITEGGTRLTIPKTDVHAVTNVRDLG